MVATNLETNLELAGGWRVAGDGRDQPRDQRKAGWRLEGGRDQLKMAGDSRDQSRDQPRDGWRVAGDGRDQPRNQPSVVTWLVAWRSGRQVHSLFKLVSNSCYQLVSLNTYGYSACACMFVWQRQIRKVCTGQRPPGLGLSVFGQLWTTYSRVSSPQRGHMKSNPETLSLSASVRRCSPRGPRRRPLRLSCHQMRRDFYNF
jgi:hypothetical protein